MTRLLDAYADVLPYGLQPTPFGEVWRALQLVASTVWDVDPAVYRAGIAWGWYVQRNPDALAAQRDLVIAALISEQAPLIKADQTTAELVEYLRQWREYRPTYDKLEALYKLFAADVEILPISTPGVPPVSDTRLAFCVRIYGVDFSRLLTLEEAYTIAIRSTPLGSRPIVYYEFDEQLSVDTQPLKAGIASINYENDAICEPVELNHYTFIVADATTGQIVSGFSNELAYGEIEGIVLQSPKLVYGVDISVPTAQFWFTANGRNETENTVLQPNSTVTVYDENGDTISDEDTIGMYDTASVLAYMQADGDMISKQDDVLIDDNGELGLQVDSGPISAWSVFAERVFTLSFVNTQLPDITITMPAVETGYKGTSITLPTMTGEYESGGKTWKPSAWDIGAFGDSYTLNADTVAHLIFEEVQQYQEITLYMASGSKRCQLSVSRLFSGNVDSERVYQLYTDEQCTTPWTGYDYSNDYEVGHYVNGEWNRYTDSVSEMPSSTAILVIGFILMDTGALWVCCNDRSSMSVTITNIVVRIYPKDQQYYAAYFNQTNIYENYSLSNGSTRTGVQRPGSTQFIQTPHQFPTITLQKVLGSAGNEITGNLSVNQGADSTSFTLNNNTGAAISIRVAIYTLEYPTFGYWLESDGTNLLTSSGVAYPLMELGGKIIEIDNGYDYFPIGLTQYNGNWASSSYAYLNKSTMGAFKSDHPTWLCFKQSNGTNTLNIACVWCYRKPKQIEVNFGDTVTIPSGFHVENVKCSRGYVFASSVSVSGTQVTYNLPGEKVYFDDTNTGLVGVGVKPALTIAAINESDGVLTYLSTRPNMSPAPTFASAGKVNSGGSLVEGTAAFSMSSTASSVQAAMIARPVYFNLTDSDDNWLYFCFNVPQTLWQFQNGVFSWLGDTTVPSSLAYWYNGRAVRIILATDE